MTDGLTNTWAATVVLGLGTMVSHGFGLSLVPALLPSIEETFASGFGALGLAVAVGLIAYAFGGLLASRVLDARSSRLVLNGSFLLTAAGLAVAASASSPTIIAFPVMLLGISAPISWAATIHVAASATEHRSRNLVMAGASGGVGAGVIVNGLLLQVFAGTGDWRRALVTASVMSVVVALASLGLFRAPIDRPVADYASSSGIRAYRVVLGTWPGRVVVFASTAAGIVTFTFMTYLTTTAVNEMGASPISTAALLWVVGGVGVVVSLSLGRMADRGSPTLMVGAIFTICAAGLVLLSVSWAYPALAVASLAIAVLNYPVWGLLGAIATSRFEPRHALRAISLGLVGASTLAALGNAAAGRWIDQTGSMRLPIVTVTLIAVVLASWLVATYRRKVAGARQGAEANRTGK